MATTPDQFSVACSNQKARTKNSVSVFALLVKREVRDGVTKAEVAAA
jgi:hypothetical protein